MESRQCADLPLAGLEIEPASARLGDALLDAEQRLRRRSAEADQDIGIGELDLAQDEGQADLLLLRGLPSLARD